MESVQFLGKWNIGAMALNIKIRTAFIVALMALGIIPLLVLTVFSYQKSVRQEFAEVKDHHLLLAQNLSSTLSRYERDLRAGVNSVSKNLLDGRTTVEDKNLLETMNIEQVSVLDPETGVELASLKADETVRNQAIDQEMLAQIKTNSTRNNLWFTPIRRYQKGNIIHLMGHFEGHFVVADIATDYFIQLGKQITFGKKGHAVIVDQDGNVLAHPRESWVVLAKNIKHVPAVERIMKGETGIEQFMSPAINEDVIAGLTPVAGAKWGVMIPFPASELYSKVLTNFMPVLWGVALEILIMCAFVYAAIRWLANPLEKFTLDMLAQYKEGKPSVVPPDRTKTNVVELKNIFSAYNDLARTVSASSKELQERVYLDPITGIGNREYFVSNAHMQISKRTNSGKKGILIFMDLDGFKEINDTRGHATGDAFLREFARSLYPATKKLMDQEFRGITGAHPIIGRIGGDEFAIALPLPDDLKDVEGFCDRLHACFPTMLIVNGITMPCSCSAGGAVYPDFGRSVEELVRRADVALYQVKANGKSAFGLYKKSFVLGGKSEILAAVINAIENNELVLEYQPKVWAHDGSTKGVEALLRWQHPVHGLIAPNYFLPAVQQTHVMEKLGEWVIDRAIKDTKELHRKGYKFAVAVNIGAEHFCSENFADKINHQCEALDFDPNFMQIEVTEDVMDVSEKLFGETVRAVQQFGFQVGIDDFGKGYSNLSRLASVPVDVIKLDKSIIGQASQNNRIKIILQSAIDMAHALGARVVVEGVETLQQVHLSEQSGADALQGFYFSKSLPLENLENWLDERQRSNPQNQVQTLQARLAAAS